jgi:hypothetical protein
MTGDEQLLRRYRRLMLVYPRWYRAERGLELLTTLLDDAPPGRRRPTLGDAADLVRGGLRARIRPPRGFGAYLAAVLVTAGTVLLGAALGVRLSAYPGPPDEARAVAAAAVAVPRQPHDVPGPVVRCDAWCPEPTGADEVVSYDRKPDHSDTVAIRWAYDQHEAAAVVARAHERLAAAGWRVEPLQVQSDGFTSLDAAKDGLVLLLVSAPDGSVSAVVAKDFAAPVLLALAAGGAGGLAVGWPLAVWLVQRFRRHHRIRRALILFTGGPVLVLAGLDLGQTVLLTVALGLIGFTPKDVQIPEFVLSLPMMRFALALVPVALAAVTAIGLTAVPGRRREPRSPAPDDAII